MSFDPADYEGKTQRFFAVQTDPPVGAPRYYILSGMVRSANRPQGLQGDRAQGSGGIAAAPGDRAQGSAGRISYYYLSGCRSCEKFLSADLPAMESRVGLSLEVERKDLLVGANYEELTTFAASIGTAVKSIPALRIGNSLLQGDAEIEARLPGILASKTWDLAASQNGDSGGPAAGVAASAAASSAAPSGDSASFRLAILPVVAAGLIDGINPCAFTTLIFLLASLALAGRGRREVLAIGAFFSVGVFLAYLGAGFGLFAALRAAQAVALVATIVRWVLVVALAALAGLSVYDFTRIRAGKPSEMLLQLPNSLKLRIHESIRERRRASALAASSFVLGLLVSIFEFACTGQVYLPTLAYLARSQGRADAMLLLLLYNACFIAPLLAVFAASYLGVSSKRIATIFQRRMGSTKLLLAAVFLALAALTVFT